jgi:sugar/nucleoside kinase (ribokinase family)
MKMLFAGDANIDFQMVGLDSFPQVDKEIFCREFTSSLGGSTTICAAAYSLLGGHASYCGLLGDDENGRFIERMLGQAGVDLDLVRFTREYATGVTVNLVHLSTRTQITYPGTLSIVDETETLQQEMHGFSHIHLGGVYTLTRFLPRIAGVLQRARADGLGTSLTTQWDPRGQWEFLKEWLPLLDYLFVNADEALSITGSASVEKAYEKLSAQTAAPLITLGESGVFARGRLTPGFAVDVRDTTGAGDTFAAGFLFAKEEKMLPFEEAVRYGCAAGAVCCTYAGGANAELTDARVMSLLS